MLRTCRKWSVVGIYRIVSNTSGRSYVGASLNVFGRLGKHVNDLRNGRSKIKELQKEYDVFGDNGFDVELLEEINSRDRKLILEIETKWYFKFSPNVFNKKPPILIQDVGCVGQHIDLKEEDKDRFYSKFDASDVGCWEWKGERTPHGYGRFRIRNKVWIASRVSYLIFYNQQPGALQVCHACDNPPCVNPSHLFLGTNQQNALDRMKKLRGGNIKLTREKVDEMRKLWLTTNMTIKEIDEKFGYKGSRGVLSNRIWYDPNYTPPCKESSVPRKRYIAFGESKTSSEWAADSRCEVGKESLWSRLKRGVPLEEALLAKKERVKARQKD